MGYKGIISLILSVIFSNLNTAYKRREIMPIANSRIHIVCPLKPLSAAGSNIEEIKDGRGNK